MRMGKTSKRTWGRSGLLTQWIIKYGYLPIILIGMVGLALDIGTREWKSDDVIVADAPVVAAPSVVAEAPVVAETFVERRPPAVEIKVEPKPIMQLTAPVMAEDLVEPPPPTMKTKVEAKPTQLAALNPDVRLPEESDQPASKGYIMYANLPTNWTPLPLPDGISSASTPHTDNIRAEIEQAAKLFDVDIQMMKAFAKIESGYNPKAKTGSYKCLFQLSNQEFAKYWQGNIYDIRDCSVAAARKFATEAAQFEKDVGRRATAAELYCIHQQGYEGCSFHYDAPQQLAWKNMYLTTEGQEKGAKWARKAIWGNVPWDLKKTIKGGVEALTSGQFIALWTERVNRFIARKVEPPTSYVQHASKAKKPTRSATTDKKKAKVAASAKKMTKLEAR
ncbi:MAG: hypothetical protein WB537_03970, partial [Pseudolabrys sp.]